MKKASNLNAGISEPGLVDAYMEKLKHPLTDVATNLRAIILRADTSIGEGIYWNAPTFFYLGKMKPFDPRTYKRYIVGFNFYKQDAIRLVFLRGVMADDRDGLLKGNYPDGRRIMTISSVENLKEYESGLVIILKSLIRKIND